jgi:catechol 2,3-dioxygenase-like lactoylglutathione lyase family enzyme
MPITRGFNHVATLTTDIERHADFYEKVFGATVTFRMDAADDRADIGEIQRLGGEWSLFFRDVDGMELEVCAPGTE